MQFCCREHLHREREVFYILWTQDTGRVLHSSPIASRINSQALVTQGVELSAGPFEAIIPSQHLLTVSRCLEIVVDS